MKTYSLIATVTAALLTFASINAINYNVALQPGAVAHAGAVHVTNLAPIHVYPSAAELREVASSAADAGSDAMVASTPGANVDHASASFKLVGSALAMPRYSFGQKFGRVSKE